VGVRRALVWLSAVALSGLAVGAALGHPATSVSRRDSSGFDVSWPQCAGAAARNMPAGRPSYLILGLTDGSGHTINPCLNSQLDWARSRGARTGAYLVASYPDRLQRRLASHGLYGACGSVKRCRLRNDGAAQATDAVAAMRAAGVPAPRVWIDVEFRQSFRWSNRPAANAAVIKGIVAGLRATHTPYGVYTTSYMWHAIAGGYILNAPNWLPVGHGGRSRALGMCATTATGGRTWLVQYTQGLDNDVTCPVLNPVPGRHDKLWRYRHRNEQLLSHGRAVRAVQRVVRTSRSGTYGPVTSLAVSRWQRSKGLPATGRVTSRDWRAMGAFRRHGGHGFWLSRIARPS
jgi:peptidoglycan hydrolase-like protein with peptidoglycan-binding domain